MKAIAWQKPLALMIEIAWVFFLVALPVTSFPYFPRAIGGAALVRPLSIYPLLVLGVLVVAPALLRQRLPKSMAILAAFVIVALASALLSFLRGIHPLLGVSVEARVLRALITLGLGVGFYLVVALLPRRVEDLQAALRWLYAGFGVALLWGSLQAIYIIRWNPTWFQWMNALQRLVSTRRLFNNRVSGMTYEPNWFAEQLSVLLLPWLLASVLSGTTIFRWRRGWLTVELLLTLWTVAIIPFTFSRAGLVNLAALAIVSLLFFRPRPARASVVAPRPKSRQVLVRIVEAAVVLAVLASLVYVAGTRNEFFARIWGYWEKKNTSLTGYFEYLGFGARFTYAETAYRVYAAYPWLGVGLGNYAFYFEEMLPERPLAEIPEVLRLVTPDLDRNQLITPKNIYLRLLAETGIVGTAVFFAFVVSIAGSALYLWLSSNLQEKFWGAGGLMGLVAFALSAFSFDSFAIPNMWIVFGLITAAVRVFRQSHGAGQPETESKTFFSLQPERL